MKRQKISQDVSKDFKQPKIQVGHKMYTKKRRVTKVQQNVIKKLSATYCQTMELEESCAIVKRRRVSMSVSPNKHYVPHVSLSKKKAGMCHHTKVSNSPTSSPFKRKTSRKSTKQVIKALDKHEDENISNVGETSLETSQECANQEIMRLPQNLTPNKSVLEKIQGKRGRKKGKVLPSSSNTAVENTSHGLSPTYSKQSQAVYTQHSKLSSNVMLLRSNEKSSALRSRRKKTLKINPKTLPEVQEVVCGASVESLKDPMSTHQPTQCSPSDAIHKHVDDKCHSSYSDGFDQGDTSQNETNTSLIVQLSPIKLNHLARQTSNSSHQSSSELSAITSNEHTEETCIPSDTRYACSCSSNTKIVDETKTVKQKYGSQRIQVKSSELKNESRRQVWKNTSTHQKQSKMLLPRRYRNQEINVRKAKSVKKTSMLLRPNKMYTSGCHEKKKTDQDANVENNRGVMVLRQKKRCIPVPPKRKEESKSACSCKGLHTCHSQNKIPQVDIQQKHFSVGDVISTTKWISTVNTAVDNFANTLDESLVSQKKTTSCTETLKTDVKPCSVKSANRLSSPTSTKMKMESQITRKSPQVPTPKCQLINEKEVQVAKTPENLTEEGKQTKSLINNEVSVTLNKLCYESVTNRLQGDDYGYSAGLNKTQTTCTTVTSSTPSQSNINSRCAIQTKLRRNSLLQKKCRHAKDRNNEKAKGNSSTLSKKRNAKDLSESIQKNSCLKSLNTRVSDELEHFTGPENRGVQVPPILQDQDNLKTSDYSPKIVMGLRPYARYRSNVGKNHVLSYNSKHWLLVQGKIDSQEEQTHMVNDVPVCLKGKRIRKRKRGRKKKCLQQKENEENPNQSVPIVQDNVSTDTNSCVPLETSSIEPPKLTVRTCKDLQEKNTELTQERKCHENKVTCQTIQSDLQKDMNSLKDSFCEVDSDADDIAVVIEEDERPTRIRTSHGTSSLVSEPITQTTSDIIQVSRRKDDNPNPIISQTQTSIENSVSHKVESCLSPVMTEHETQTSDCKVIAEADGTLSLIISSNETPSPDVEVVAQSTLVHVYVPAQSRHGRSPPGVISQHHPQSHNSDVKTLGECESCSTYIITPRESLDPEIEAVTQTTSGDVHIQQDGSFSDIDSPLETEGPDSKIETQVVLATHSVQNDQERFPKSIDLTKSTANPESETQASSIDVRLDNEENVTPKEGSLHDTQNPDIEKQELQIPNGDTGVETIDDSDQLEQEDRPIHIVCEQESSIPDCDMGVKTVEDSDQLEQDGRPIHIVCEQESSIPDSDTGVEAVDDSDQLEQDGRPIHIVAEQESLTPDCDTGVETVDDADQLEQDDCPIHIVSEQKSSIPDCEMRVETVDDADQFEQDGRPIHIVSEQESSIPDCEMRVETVDDADQLEQDDRPIHIVSEQESSIPDCEMRVETIDDSDQLEQDDRPIHIVSELESSIPDCEMRVETVDDADQLEQDDRPIHIVCEQESSIPDCEMRVETVDDADQFEQDGRPIHIVSEQESLTPDCDMGVETVSDYISALSEQDLIPSFNISQQEVTQSVQAISQTLNICTQETHSMLPKKQSPDSGSDNVPVFSEQDTYINETYTSCQQPTQSIGSEVVYGIMSGDSPESVEQHNSETQTTSLAMTSCSSTLEMIQLTVNSTKSCSLIRDKVSDTSVDGLVLPLFQSDLDRKKEVELEFAKRNAESQMDNPVKELTSSSSQVEGNLGSVAVIQPDLSSEYDSDNLLSTSEKSSCVQECEAQENSQEEKTNIPTEDECENACVKKTFIFKQLWNIKRVPKNRGQETTYFYERVDEEEVNKSQSGIEELKQPSCSYSLDSVQSYHSEAVSHNDSEYVPKRVIIPQKHLPLAKCFTNIGESQQHETETSHQLLTPVNCDKETSISINDQVSSQDSQQTLTEESFSEKPQLIHEKETNHSEEKCNEPKSISQDGTTSLMTKTNEKDMSKELNGVQQAALLSNSDGNRKPDELITHNEKRKVTKSSVTFYPSQREKRSCLSTFARPKQIAMELQHSKGFHFKKQLSSLDPETSVDSLQVSSEESSSSEKLQPDISSESSTTSSTDSFKHTNPEGQELTPKFEGSIPEEVSMTEINDRTSEVELDSVMVDTPFTTSLQGNLSEDGKYLKLSKETGNVTRGRRTKNWQNPLLANMTLRKKDQHFLFSRLGFKKSKQRKSQMSEQRKHMVVKRELSQFPVEDFVKPEPLSGTENQHKEFLHQSNSIVPEIIDQTYHQRKHAFKSTSTHKMVQTLKSNSKCPQTRQRLGKRNLTASKTLNSEDYIFPAKRIKRHQLSSTPLTGSVQSNNPAMSKFGISIPHHLLVHVPRKRGRPKKVRLQDPALGESSVISDVTKQTKILNHQVGNEEILGEISRQDDMEARGVHLIDSSVSLLSGQGKRGCSKNTSYGHCSQSNETSVVKEQPLLLIPPDSHVNNPRLKLNQDVDDQSLPQFESQKKGYKRKILKKGNKDQSFDTATSKPKKRGRPKKQKDAIFESEETKLFTKKLQLLKSKVKKGSAIRGKQPKKDQASNQKNAITPFKVTKKSSLVKPIVKKVLVPKAKLTKKDWYSRKNAIVPSQPQKRGPQKVNLLLKKSKALLAVTTQNKLEKSKAGKNVKATINKAKLTHNDQACRDTSWEGSQPKKRGRPKKIKIESQEAPANAKQPLDPHIRELSVTKETAERVLAQKDPPLSLPKKKGRPKKTSFCESQETLQVTKVNLHVVRETPGKANKEPSNKKMGRPKKTMNKIKVTAANRDKKTVLEKNQQSQEPRPKKKYCPKKNSTRGIKMKLAVTKPLHPLVNKKNLLGKIQTSKKLKVTHKKTGHPKKSATTKQWITKKKFLEETPILKNNKTEVKKMGRPKKISLSEHQNYKTTGKRYKLSKPQATKFLEIPRLKKQKTEVKKMGRPNKISFSGNKATSANLKKLQTLNLHINKKTFLKEIASPKDLKSGPKKMGHPKKCSLSGKRAASTPTEQPQTLQPHIIQGNLLEEYGELTKRPKKMGRPKKRSLTKVNVPSTSTEQPQPLPPQMIRGNFLGEPTTKPKKMGRPKKSSLTKVNVPSTSTEQHQPLPPQMIRGNFWGEPTTKPKKMGRPKKSSLSEVKVLATPTEQPHPQIIKGNFLGGQTTRPKKMGRPKKSSLSEVKVLSTPTEQPHPQIIKGNFLGGQTTRPKKMGRPKKSSLSEVKVPSTPTEQPQPLPPQMIRGNAFGEPTTKPKKMGRPKKSSLSEVKVLSTPTEQPQPLPPQMIRENFLGEPMTKPKKIGRPKKRSLIEVKVLSTPTEQPHPPIIKGNFLGEPTTRPKKMGRPKKTSLSEVKVLSTPTEQPQQLQPHIIKLNLLEECGELTTRPKKMGRPKKLISSVSRSKATLSNTDQLQLTHKIRGLIPGYVGPAKDEEFILEEFCSLESLEEAVQSAAVEWKTHQGNKISRKRKKTNSLSHLTTTSAANKRRAKRSSRSPEGSYWDCSVCTYRNKAEAFKCAMCDVRKGTSTRKPRLNAQLVAQQQAQQNLSPLIHVKTTKTTPRSPAQRKAGTSKKPRPRLKNVDRSSAISTEVVVNNVPVIITEYKEKSHTRTTIDSDDASAERTNGNVNGL